MTAGLLAPLVAAVGSLVAAALLSRRSRGTPLWLSAVALGPALGFGGLSLLYFAWRLAGGSSPRFAAVGWGALAVAAGIALQRLRGALGAPPPAGPAGWSRLAAGLLLAVTLFVLAAGVATTRQLPYGRFDAWAIWSSRARLLHRAEDPGAAFGRLQRTHPDYPLLLPGSLAAQFTMAGSEAPAIPQATGAVFLFAAATALLWAVRAVGGQPGWAVLAAALFLATPMALREGFAQCADVPLAYLAVTGATLVALALPRAEPAGVSPMLAGFLLGLLAWTKNEGLLLAGFIGASFAAHLAARQGGLRRLATVVAGALPGLAAVGLLRLAWSPKTDLGAFAGGALDGWLDPGRWPLVLGAFWERLAPWHGFASWGLVWALAALAGAVGWRSTGRPGGAAAFLAATTPLLWIAWLAVFLGTPNDPEWQIRTSLDRLLLQLLPVTLAAGFGLLGPASERGTGAR